MRWRDFNSLSLSRSPSPSLSIPASLCLCTLVSRSHSPTLSIAEFASSQRLKQSTCECLHTGPRLLSTLSVVDLRHGSIRAWSMAAVDDDTLEVGCLHVGLIAVRNIKPVKQGGVMGDFFGLTPQHKPYCKITLGVSEIAVGRATCARCFVCCVHVCAGDCRCCDARESARRR